MQKWFAGYVIGLICLFNCAAVAQVTATPGEKLSAALGKLQGYGGQIFFPCGNYDADGTIDVKADGVYLRGSGYCSRIHVTTNSDVFNVTGALFVLEGFEILIDTQQDRTEANFIHGNNSQGRVSHVRFTGSSKPAAVGRPINNGRAFFANSQAGGLWEWEDVRFTGGSTWRAFIALTSPDKTVASTRVINAVGGVSFTDAAFDLNGAIDTFQVTQIDIPLRSGHVFWLRNTVGSQIAPRWVLCSNCSIETRGTTAIQLDASRDFSYHGYIAGADLGVYVGPHAIDTDLSFIDFNNLTQGAVSIAAGAVNTFVKDNFFEDTTNLAANRYDTVTVAAGATNFQITGNAWRSSNQYKPRYAINIAANGTSDYRVSFNQIPNGTYATAPISTPAPGPNSVIMGNNGAPDKSSVK